MQPFSPLSARISYFLLTSRWGRIPPTSPIAAIISYAAFRTLRLLLAIGLVTLAACAVSAESVRSNAANNAQSAVSLRVVSTPNPNVFPLLLAMSQTPGLAVSLVPVATGNDIVHTFSAGQGDALLSMTYTAAQEVVTGKVPQLQLVQVNFWRGFWMLAPRSANIAQFSQMDGQGVLVAGPTTGGQGGGPDLFFQAAIERTGMTSADFKLCYLPVMQAAPMIAQQQQMDSNPACDPSFSKAPAAISLVEPAATGLVLQSRMAPSGEPLRKSIDLQTLFTGYTTWPSNQLPHGGVSVLSTVLENPSRLAITQSVLKAYRVAANEIMAAKGHPLAMMKIAKAISTGITTYYGQYGLSLPAPVIFASLQSGDLVYRTDLLLNAIQPDLAAFLTEVVGTPPPASFYHPL